MYSAKIQYSTTIFSHLPDSNSDLYTSGLVLANKIGDVKEPIVALIDHGSKANLMSIDFYKKGVEIQGQHWVCKPVHKPMHRLGS